MFINQDETPEVETPTETPAEETPAEETSEDEEEVEEQFSTLDTLLEKPILNKDMKTTITNNLKFQVFCGSSFPYLHIATLWVALCFQPLEVK